MLLFLPDDTAAQDKRIVAVLTFQILNHLSSEFPLVSLRSFSVTI